MYRIVKVDGTELGLTESVNYIKFGESGCYTNASRYDAIGVAFQSIPYNLIGHDEIKDADTVVISSVDGGIEVNNVTNTVNTMLGLKGLVASQRAEQFHYALQLFASTLDEDKALMIATIYDEWNPNSKAYETGEYCTYGENTVGDPQLYVCIQAHISQEDWTPDVAVSLFKAVGVTNDGYPEWAQPVGVSDAYMKGDIVSYNENLYISLVDNNIWSPEVYPDGWKLYSKED